jgi:hypothetical protein
VVRRAFSCLEQSMDLTDERWEALIYEPPHKVGGRGRP